jgi:hypothetical protein
MYLIVGGSHPHAFLHDRRMIGRDMQREWGTLNYRSDAPTQVYHNMNVLTMSAFVDSHRMQCQPLVEAFI